MRAALLCLVFIAIGCKEKNPNYCPDQPQNLCEQVDAPGMQCDDNTDCTDPMAKICKMPGNFCVQCIDNTTCGPDAPICSPTSNRCGPCTKHSDCTDSNVCLDSGACAAKESVFYVKAGGSDTGSCDLGSPCATVSYALSVTPTTKTIIKVDGSITESNGVTLANRNIDIYGETAPQAIVTRPGGNEIVRIDGTSGVSIYGLQLSGATGANGHAISILSGSSGAITLKKLRLVNNGGIGLFAQGQGKLVMTQCTVFNNASGGGSFEGTHTLDVTSNFFTYNGSADAVTGTERGGVRVTADRMTSRFEYNTVAFNKSKGVVNRGGLHCNAPNVSAAANLVYRNFEYDAISGTAKADAGTQMLTGAGACPYGNTLASAMDTVHLGFKSPLADPFDFHLDPAKVPTVVRDAAGACTIRDVDNEARPSGAGCELGADELSP